MATIKKPIKKAQSGTSTKKKTGMDAVKAVGKYVSTFGGATERDNPKQKDINIVKKIKETGAAVKNKLGLKNGGKVKKELAAGVGAKSKKAGMVDPKGAWTKVQERTIGKAKSGAKVSKKKK